MENNKEYNVRLRKIPVFELMEVMKSLYERGVDYVDIFGKNDEEQDVIGFFFNDMYMSMSKIDEENLEDTNMIIGEDDIGEDIDRIIDDEGLKDEDDLTKLI